MCVCVWARARVCVCVYVCIHVQAHVDGRKEQGQIRTHTHTHMRSISREGGVTIASLRQLFVSPNLTGVCCGYLAGATSCMGSSACAAGKYGPHGSTSSSAATCTGLCVAGKYSNAGASSESVSAALTPFSPALLSMCLTCTYTRADAFAEGASGILLHACAHA